MNRFASRSCLTELIDAPDVPFSEWKICLKELNLINAWLGGHQTTVYGFRKLLRRGGGSVTIAELGCGGGDNLNAIDRWNRKSRNPRTVNYIGIDINRACIDFARENCRHLTSARFIHADYYTVRFKEPPDIVFSSLFCHHLDETQLRQLMGWLKQNSCCGFFMNDLHRHPFAYYSIQLLTRCFSKSRLVKNDAPVSVLRGFHKQEWRQLLQETGFDQYEISWRWAFRYLISVKYA